MFLGIELVRRSPLRRTFWRWAAAVSQLQASDAPAVLLRTKASPERGGGAERRRGFPKRTSYGVAAHHLRAQ